MSLHPKLDYVTAFGLNFGRIGNFIPSETYNPNITQPMKIALAKLPRFLCKTLSKHCPQ
ncbi:hypothetical protein N9B54_03310 [Mariniblastus sp.]|nr:hypothetical protein [Mariniblastus sp.]